jgi:hypothetical protein
MKKEDMLELDFQTVLKDLQHVEYGHLQHHHHRCDGGQDVKCGPNS